jgi:hypothetical protein
VPDSNLKVRFTESGCARVDVGQLTLFANISVIEIDIKDAVILFTVLEGHLHWPNFINRESAERAEAFGHFYTERESFRDSHTDVNICIGWDKLTISVEAEESAAGDPMFWTVFKCRETCE